MRSLCAAHERAGRRAHALAEQLLATVPAQAYELLLEKYRAALAALRDTAVSKGAAVGAADDADGEADGARLLRNVTKSLDKHRSELGLPTYLQTPLLHTPSLHGP